MEVVLAAKISYITTTNNLLLKTYFRGRCRSCVETIIHHLLEKIYAAWNENKIAFLLMMDVFAAYLNTSHQHLLHNLRIKRIDVKIVDWVTSFLTNCQTIVKTNKYTTPKLSIEIGLLQGLPLFSIFYLFYNGDLLDDCAKKKVDTQGYIGDITLIAISKLGKNNNQKLARVL